LEIAPAAHPSQFYFFLELEVMLELRTVSQLFAMTEAEPLVELLKLIKSRFEELQHAFSNDQALVTLRALESVRRQRAMIWEKKFSRQRSDAD
jgi:hypothetical protein